MPGIFKWFKQKGVLLFLGGFVVAILFIFSGKNAVEATGTDEYCASCHKVHPQATASWKRSTHYDNKRGIVVHCIECHLPPEGLPKFTRKVSTGLRDVYGTIFKDPAEINWEEKSRPENAIHHTYQASCLRCHKNIFPLGLTDKGQEAHLYYDNNREKLNCLNCHIGVGHYSETTVHASNVSFGKKMAVPDTVYSEAAEISSFENFTEHIPGTGVSFTMIAIPEGKFQMGSPAKEKFRDPDEGPQHEVEVSPFFMGQIEVTWEEYMAFLSETGSEGRVVEKENAAAGVDGITGPTPPWGAPDQGWGGGKRPAITMTYHAATVYCKWLSLKTGKSYRLPTEAEWEYAARGGTTGDYFFEGDAGKYTSEGFGKKIFGPDTSVINRYAVYRENSHGMTALPSTVMPNPFGLKNMPGNAAEFCSDVYRPGYENKGAAGTGIEEHVVRGGSYKSDARDLRSTARDHTRTTDWLKTDPQMPKSVWWYSDQVHVGFRVVCDPPQEITGNN